MRSGALRSLSRCTPRSRTSASTSARVVCDSSTWPPWPTAAMRAPLCTSRPTYPSSVSRGSPVCSPIRTRIGPSASARWPSDAAATASDARAKATKNASPCVSTSTPSCSANAARSRRRCSCSASPYSSPSSCSSRVEPSTSVNNNVTTPVGRSRTIAHDHGATPLRCPARLSPSRQRRCAFELMQGPANKPVKSPAWEAQPGVEGSRVPRLVVT